MNCLVIRMAKLKPQEIVLYPLMTEKAVALIEAENKLTFIVDAKASKEDVAKAVEELYDVKVASVNTINLSVGKKKAYVKLDPKFKASDLAIKLGIL